MNDFEKKKRELIEHLVDLRALKTERIIKAFNQVPRHLFVREQYVSEAYADYPLPTFSGQTISQPYTVAIMLEALQPKSGDKALDIGCGSGWTSALLANIVGRRGVVIGIDILPELVEFARKNIAELNIENVKLICGDGKLGFPNEAPYDCVLINAACHEIPSLLIEQTKIGGRIVAPIESYFEQRLIVAEKISEKKLKKRDLGGYVFVPLR